MTKLPQTGSAETYELVKRIMAADDPAQLLQYEIGRLHEASLLKQAVAVFEAVLFRATIERYWVYYRMCDIYSKLGRDDAAFFCANIAIKLEPSAPSWHLYQALYKYFKHTGAEEEAVDAYLRQVERTPENPIVPLEEVRPLLARRNHPLAAAPTQQSTALIMIHVLEEASSTIPVVGRCYGNGSTYPLTLRPYRFAYARPPVEIVELHDAQVLIYNNNVIIIASDGQTFTDLSVSELPDLIKNSVLSHGADAIQRDADTAVVISDRFPAPNLCHFLLDQVTRLELYERLGARLSESVVIGPPVSTHYQMAILKQLNVVNYVPTTDLCIVRARRLLISKTCRTTHMHPAHGGASWALNYIRNAFGIAGSERKKNRLYISRADARARKIANESEVTACLRRSGFTEIIAADLSFDEQVDLFRHASHVVSIHGAGLTNIVFCPPGAHILEFFHPLYGSWAYGVLSAALSLDYRPFIGCDALSDDQLYNDPDQPDFAAFGLAGRDAALNRDIRVDIAQIEEWLMDVT